MPYSSIRPEVHTFCKNRTVTQSVALATQIATNKSTGHLQLQHFSKGKLFEIESSSYLFKSHQKVSEEIHPPTHTRFFFPKESDQNFDVAVLLEIVRRSDDINFGVNITPLSPEEL